MLVEVVVGCYSVSFSFLGVFEAGLACSTSCIDVSISLERDSEELLVQS